MGDAKILRPDICVIGGGSGGLVVAAIAASFDVPVVLIEQGKMGGDCLNYGCVPSKALLAAARQIPAIAKAERFGITAGKPKIDFAKVNAHVREVIASIAPNDSIERFKAMGVQIIKARGRFIDTNTVEAGGHHIKARRFVIATGSSPFIPPIAGINDVNYLTNETIFDNTQKPDHLIIIGGGPIGVEMAQAHRRLGCRVSVLEAAKALGRDDPEMAALLLDHLRNEGIEIVEQVMIDEIIGRGASGVRVKYRHSKGENEQVRQISGSHLLVAAGRRANLAELGLEAAGIDFDKRGIKVKADLRTSNGKVYAIGDVVGALQFTHVASYHAGLVARGILFRKKAVPDYQTVPWVSYTDPELAHIGLSESQARKRYKRIRVLRWPFHENDRSTAERKTTGHVKIITTKRGKILGADIIGANAGEMINLFALALSKKMKIGDIAGFISPYPTVSEAAKRAATTYYVPFASNRFVRGLIGFLRKFG